MRLLARNKQVLWYANPTGYEPVINANGHRTGEKLPTYGEPVQVRMSMSISSGANNLGSQGMANLEPYGIITGYTHRAVTEDMNCPIREESHIWYKIPPIENGVTVPHNFKVVRKASSLNHLIYYLKEVDVG